MKDNREGKGIEGKTGGDKRSKGIEDWRCGNCLIVKEREEGKGS
jgi:hypothetical protein